MRIGILPEIKTTEPYSPNARANASAKPVITPAAGPERSPEEGLQPIGAQGRGGFFEFGFEIVQNWLDRAHDERQTDKSQGNGEPSGANATLIPNDSRYLPSQPLVEYSAVNVIPATAVGSANGRSTSHHQRLARES